MSVVIDIRDLPVRINEALAHAAAGDEVVLFEGATPRAPMAPLGHAAPPCRRPAAR
jgi:antitoxin (DNA-binding transcriptional repressor) of toxin-antitoxin stability system